MNRPADDPAADPTGLGIHRPLTTPVVPVEPADTADTGEPPPSAAPVELPTAYVRPVVPGAPPVA